MVHEFGKRQLQAFLRATRSAIDPNRSILAASTPYVVGGSVGPVSRELVAAGALASHGSDADYVHLEFELGAEVEGPVNVKVGIVRAGIVHVRESGRFWQGEDGGMVLVVTAGSKAATMSFDPDGMDSRPGLPAGDLDAGYARAAARLRDLADRAIASNDLGPVHMVRAAA